MADKEVAPLSEQRLQEEVAKAIATIEESRETHIEWRDHYQNRPFCTDCTASVRNAAGDLGHQEECIAKYDHVLATLRELQAELTRSRAALLESEQGRIDYYTKLGVANGQLEAAEQKLAEQRWIPVSEKLPEEGRWVWCAIGERTTLPAFVGGLPFGRQVTHWMYAPAAPSVEREG
jgi:hypothetical protein